MFGVNPHNISVLQVNTWVFLFSTKLVDKKSNYVEFPVSLIGHMFDIPGVATNTQVFPKLFVIIASS